MSTLVAVALLSAEELAAEVDKLRPLAPFAILDRPDAIDFPGWDERVEWPTWPRGRVFGKDAELRWELEAGAWRAVLLRADGGSIPRGFEVVLTLDDAMAGRPERYFMWGEKDVAIGGRLNYSRVIPGEGRPELWLVRYVDSVGRLVFYRYVGLNREDAHAGEDQD